VPELLSGSLGMVFIAKRAAIFVAVVTTLSQWHDVIDHRCDRCPTLGLAHAAQRLGV